MASFSSKQQKQFHIRSISLPSRLHPSNVRITEELNKLNTWETTACIEKAETILTGLSGLADLYDGIQDLLQTSRTQQAQLRLQHQKWVDEVLEGSVRLLDMCDTSRNILLQMKETTKDVQMALRKRGGESSWESSIDGYMCCKKKARKEINKCLGEMKRLEAKFGSSYLLSDLDQHQSAVVSALREASSIAICVFRSLLSYISTASRAKTSKWSLVTKLLQKEKIVSKEDDEVRNEVEGVDMALHGLCGLNSNKEAKVERLEVAQKRLKALELGLEGLEDGLERLFKSLIQARVTLLNNLSLARDYYLLKPITGIQVLEDL